MRLFKIYENEIRSIFLDPPNLSTLNFIKSIMNFILLVVVPWIKLYIGCFLKHKRNKIYVRRQVNSHMSPSLVSGSPFRFSAQN